MSLMCSAPAFADSPNNDIHTEDRAHAAQRLEDVLQQAGEQGLVEYKRPSTPKPALTQSLLHNDKSKAPKVQNLVPKTINPNCALSASMDLGQYAYMKKFSDLSVNRSAKSVENSASKSDADQHAELQKPLRYIALGLGTEAVAQSGALPDESARLLQAMGRVISKSSKPADRDLFQAYTQCDDSFSIWQTAARLPFVDFENGSAYKINVSDLDILQDWPSELKNILGSRFAIFAAETGDTRQAERYLYGVAPDSRRKILPEYFDDDLLYLYALIRRNKKDPTALSVFEYIASREGLFRTRSLQHLATASAAIGQALPSEFSTDMKAVAQLNTGNSKGRDAALAMAALDLEHQDFIPAIAIIREAMGMQDAEYSKGVNMVGEALQNSMGHEKPSRQVRALNTYLEELAFFETYEKRESLHSQAFTTALDLYMPEIAKQLKDQGGTENVKGDPHLETDAIRRADALLAYKTGDYSHAVKLMSPAKDASATSMRQNAALSSKNPKLIDSVFSTTTQMLKSEAYAQYLLQAGQWRQAQTVRAQSKIQDLEALAGAALLVKWDGMLDYIVEADKNYTSKSIPATAPELDEVLNKVKADTDIVKAYIING